MREPIIEHNKLRTWCRNIIKMLDKWFIKYILKPIFFVLPPLLLNTIATEKGLQGELVSLFGNKIGVFLNNSAFIIIVIAFLYVTLMKAAYAAIDNYSKPDKGLEVDDLIALLTALDTVVGDKTRRMAIEAKAVISQKQICGKSTFLQITRPDQQIALLVIGLRTVFEFMNNKITFRVGLLRIEHNKPVDWYAFDPRSHPPRTLASNLGAPSSTVSHCIKTKSIVVVENIQHELKKKSKKERRFLKSHTQEQDNGSQLCYPLVHPSTNQIEYVITIAGNCAYSLVEKNAELYSWIIRHFAVRITMEHSLLILKEKTEL